MKGVSEVISIALIVIISIGLIATALMYGYPLIQKTQDRAQLEKVASVFSPELTNSLVKKLEYISNFGGSDSINIGVDGVWEVRSYTENSPYNNSISFSFFSKVTNIRSNQYISLTPGEKCPPEVGLAGAKSPFVVCISGSQVADGFNITYTLFARNLDSEHQAFYTRILTSAPIERSTLKNIRISRENVDTYQEGGKRITVITLRIVV
ncbi:MAG: hypothetical protein N3D78_01595 [Candidatus Aenigmarchaeota archaeon]|nr:hypothetical protein [Candidatus Aenigmarchaeota archaeon]